MDNENIKGLDDVMRRLAEAQEYIKQDVPVLIGVLGETHFKQSFHNEGFTDKGLQKWAPRKTKRTGSTNSQKVLTQSKKLENSVVHRVEGNTVIFSSDMPYAQVHNEGGNITVTPKMKAYFWAMHLQAKDAGNLEMADQWKGLALAKKIVMPQRQFMGESKALDDKIATEVTNGLTRILNG